MLVVYPCHRPIRVGVGVGVRIRPAFIRVIADHLSVFDKLNSQDERQYLISTEAMRVAKRAAAEAPVYSLLPNLPPILPYPIAYPLTT